MATRSEKIRLGVFLTTATLLFLVTVAYLIGAELWTERPTYVIRFSDSVSGLDVGSPVKYQGVRVGRVDVIRVDPDNIELVEVTISVVEGTPIKRDHTAVVNVQGVTGIKFIELRGGTMEAGDLGPGGEIRAGANVLDQITGQVSDISVKVDQLVSNLLLVTRAENQQVLDSTLRGMDGTLTKVDAVLTDLHKTTSTMQAMLEENRKPLRATMKNLATSTAHADQTLADLDRAIADVRTELKDAQLGATTAEIRALTSSARDQVEQLKLERTVEHVSRTLASLQRVLNGVAETVGQNQESIRLTIQNLRRASDSLRELSRTFQQKPVIQVFGQEPEERDVP